MHLVAVAGGELAHALAVDVGRHHARAFEREHARRSRARSPDAAPVTIATLPASFMCDLS